MTDTRFILSVLFIFSFFYHVMMGYTPTYGEPVLTTGVKRVPSFSLRVHYPKYPDNLPDNREEEWYGKRLPDMYWSYKTSRLENEFWFVDVMRFISSIWMLILGGVILDRMCRIFMLNNDKFE